MEVRKGIMWKALFWIYIVMLFTLVVVKFNGSFMELSNRIESIKVNRMEGVWNLNLIPFRSIGAQLEYITQWWALKNILANLIAFMPLGFLLPISYPRFNSFYRAFIISLISILLIEVFQLITLIGFFDVDDISLNLLGAIIGYVIYKIFMRISQINK